MAVAWDAVQTKVLISDAGAGVDGLARQPIEGVFPELEGPTDKSSRQNVDCRTGPLQLTSSSTLEPAIRPLVDSRVEDSVGS